MALAAAETSGEREDQRRSPRSAFDQAARLAAVFKSVAKTHRVVIVEQDRPFCGVGAEISYRIQQEIFDELDAPILRVSQEDVPMPYNEALEKAVLPSAEKIVAAVRKICYA